MLANADEDVKKRWFSKILTHMDLYEMNTVFTPEVVWKYALDDEVINLLFPDNHKMLWKSIKKRLKNLGLAEE